MLILYKGCSRNKCVGGGEWIVFWTTLVAHFNFFMMTMVIHLEKRHTFPLVPLWHIWISGLTYTFCFQNSVTFLFRVLKVLVRNASINTPNNYFSCIFFKILSVTVTNKTFSFSNITSWICSTLYIVSYVSICAQKCHILKFSFWNAKYLFILNGVWSYNKKEQ